MVFQTLECERPPLNLQYSRNLRTVVAISTIIGLLILGSKNVLGL